MCFHVFLHGNHEKTAEKMYRNAKKCLGNEGIYGESE